ncbi:RNA-directed DNA polymerase, eukaryota [Tanacetum coccineum]
MGSYRSKEDDVSKISTSIFITNLSETISAKELFNTCKQYGHVVDAFIPTKRSKDGKMFGFVRFINVLNVERLVNNLCTIWVGRFKFHANIAKFNRTPLKNDGSQVKNKGGIHSSNTNGFKKDNGVNGVVNSYVHVVKGISKSDNMESVPFPVLVLDDECLNSYDLSNSLFGRVKEISSLSNLKMVLAKEGFDNIRIQYMGELWVSLEFATDASKKLFQSNVGVGSWFSQLIQASMEFTIEGRIAWVEIEGVPFKLWSENTFKRIASKWGVLLHMDDQEENCFHSKRLCISTKVGTNISESFKIIYRGKVSWIRANEAPGWVPEFMDESDEESDSDVSLKEEDLNVEVTGICRDESDVEEVPETLFEERLQNNNNLEEMSTGQKDNHSEDPFDIYKLLNKKKEVVETENKSDHSLKYPPGYTPKHDKGIDCSEEQEPNKERGEISQGGYVEEIKFCSKDDVSNKGSKEEVAESVCSMTPRTGGSILNLMEELVKVRHTMGYNMEGLAQKAKRDWVKELCVKNKVNVLAIQETKMEKMDILCAQMCWGNLAFDYVHSDSVGNSGVSVYAPQDLNEKKMMWDYLTYVINNWKGEVVLMGDFNEVRNKSEQFGSKFNVQGAKVFNSFIANAGLKEVPLGEELQAVDVIIDKGEGTDEVVKQRMDILKNLQDMDKIFSMELVQKAKIKWSIEGDENSSFYHGVINKKRSQLSIRGVMIKGIWTDVPYLVKREFLHHFKARFDKPTIKRAIWDCGIDKSLGPDGFMFGFYRRFWKVIENDVYEAVQYFFSHGVFPNGCNSSFIALIPKITDTNLVKDFRPISLIGSLYKIIAKILANRLVPVLGDIVNEVQSAFISERQILDGPFILNEVIQWCKSKKKQSLIFKVDFEKAYDSVRWDFLDDVLKKFSFGDKWCNWIQNCLRSSRGSIIINGSATEEFQFYKGLKQGDPLSPFLFILVMESLHLSFQRVVNAGMFKGIMLSSSLNLSHMFYADDAVFVGQWCDGNVDTLVHVLECFFRASGLRINMCKSKIMGVCVEEDKVKRAASKLGCLILKPPFSYLGSKVGGLMSRVQAWDEMVDRVTARLSKWKMKTLSIGGSNKSSGKMGQCVGFKAQGGLGVSSLYALYRSPYVQMGVELVKDVSVASKFAQSSMDFSFRRKPRDGVEQEQYVALLDQVKNITLGPLFDRRIWSLENSVEFSVASVRKMIDDKMLSDVAIKTRWLKSIPIKVNVHAWKVRIDSLPTRLNISRRGPRNGFELRGAVGANSYISPSEETKEILMVLEMEDRVVGTESDTPIGEDIEETNVGNDYEMEEIAEKDLE